MQEARRVASAHDVRQPLQGGAITPVQIFQDEHQRAGRGEHLQCLGELPQHAGGRDAAGQVLEALPVLGGEQGREVHEPARGILPQHGDKRRALGSPAQASQRLQHGEIGFPRPILVHALAVPDPDVLRGAHLGDKGLHQGRLADAGFPNNHAHLALPLPHRGPPLRELGQFGVTPNKEWRAADRGGQWAVRPLHHRRPFRRHGGADRCDEPIPPAVHRLDKAGGARLIAQHPAQRAHGHREDGLTHHRVGPDRLEQRVFGHELARLRHQAAEDRKGFRGQRGHLVATPQPFVAQIEPERPEDETLRLLHTLPFPCQPGDGYGAYTTRFLGHFFRQFFTTSSGLWPVQNTMLQPQSRGQHHVHTPDPRSISWCHQQTIRPPCRLPAPLSSSFGRIRWLSRDT